MSDDELIPLIALAERIQAICLGHGITVATAESCTGGLVAHLLTEVAGSSGYLRGGVVSYADDVKARVLGVEAEVLAAHGAVSAQVARGMARGARATLGADVAVAITGIAGPGGGSEAKPVGLTYVGVADDEGTDVRRFVWSGDRSANKRASARAALELLFERVSGRAAASADAAPADAAPADAAATGEAATRGDATAPGTTAAPVEAAARGTTAAPGTTSASASEPSSAGAERE